MVFTSRVHVDFQLIDKVRLIQHDQLLSVQLVNALFFLFFQLGQLETQTLYRLKRVVFFDFVLFVMVRKKT